MSKKKDKIIFYKNELLKYEENPNYPLLEAIVDYLSPSVHLADAEIVSTSDEKEVETVKTNFLKKKLNLEELDGEILDLSIISVRDIFGSSNTKKYRALFYYFLTKRFQLESVFIKEIQAKVEKEEESNLSKLEQIAKVKPNNTKIKGKGLLYILVAMDIVVIVIILIKLLF
jgi:hypothetical protein